ncbi:MAG: mechanosensitive ion channel family protein [Nitrospirae bacterium]|nr:mechanosensitive ion channel family protein [Nitrospirota bacterium]NTW65999.1 mechanosensitive ion channel family protein [Nitrospirota bacterium]
MLKNIMFILALVLSLTGGQTAYAAPSPQPAAGKEEVVQTAPVRVDGAVLFTVRGLAAFTAHERARNIAGRITSIAGDRAVKPESIVAVETEQATELRAGTRLIMYVFDDDAEREGVSRQMLARAYVGKIQAAVEVYRRDRDTRSIAWASGSALGATLVFVALVQLIRFLFRKLLSLAEKRYALKVRQLQEKSHDIVRTEGIWTVFKGGLRAARIVIILILAFFYIDVVLHLFPWTRAFAVPMLDLMLTPLRSIGRAVLEYLPNLAFLIILVLVARYGLNLLRAFFLGVHHNRITFTGFEPAWALPTYKLARLAVIAFTVVVAYPYIPGSESPAFKGVSLFLGVVFSLGSSSSIANIVAGYMVIFRRAFKVGDRVKIGAQTGDVVEMRLQATHLRTIKNEEIIVPNSLIINTEVVNYSSLARKGGLILHTSVTIGYDTPWRQVHAMLLLAAERTPGLLKEPKPFVLQTALNDFYVGYELNVYTDRPLEMVKIYSDLHQNIQDAFNEFGVQIMSPHYLGDPSKAKIVPKEQWSPAPAKPEQKT